MIHGCLNPWMENHGYGEPTIRLYMNFYMSEGLVPLCCFSATKLCLILKRPHGLQHTRLPCPSLSPGVCSNSRPLSWWRYRAISSFAAPFSFCLQSFPYHGLSQWVSSSHQVVSVLELQLQPQCPKPLHYSRVNYMTSPIIQMKKLRHK